MINVLLVSPRLPPTDRRYCGDQGYTDTLLQHPPPGVRYHHYEDLLARGKIRRIRSLQTLSYYLTRWGLLPPDMWFEALASDFVPDILHIYAFSARVRLPSDVARVPLLLGQGTGSYSDLKYYLNWKSERRIHFARWRKRQYLRLIGAHDSSLRPEHASHVHVWSQFSRQMHLDEGQVQSSQIEVLYPGLSWRGGQLGDRFDGGKATFLFVGRDFERKNGELVLEAFRQVHSRYEATKLIVIGQPSNGQTIDEPGVIHHTFLPRRELMERIYPQADVFVLPSKAEGFGLVLLEAMSFGMPLIAVNAWAMPEIIEDGENGFLIKPDALDDLIDRMERLAAHPELTAHMRRQNRQIFYQKFSVEAHNQQLRSIYDRVLASS